jgi:hypothetical protein
MVEATCSLSQAYCPERLRKEGNVVRIPTAFETRLRHMIIWEARLEAREIIKRKLKAEGIRVSLLSASTQTPAGPAPATRGASPSRRLAKPASRSCGATTFPTAQSVGLRRRSL